jgi:hypothetical protein
VDFMGAEGVHESLAAAMDGYLGRRQRFAVVFGSRPAGRGEPGTAKAQFGWLRAEHERLAGGAPVGRCWSTRLIRSWPSGAGVPPPGSTCRSPDTSPARWTRR